MEQVETGQDNQGSNSTTNTNIVFFMGRCLIFIVVHNDKKTRLSPNAFGGQYSHLPEWLKGHLK